MVPEWVSQSFPKCYQKFVKKWSKKWPILGSKMGAKFSLNRDRRAKAFSTMSWILSFIYFRFSLGFGALWVSLGSFLGHLEAFLGGLWIQKRVKTKCFLRFLKRRFFGLWSSWQSSVFILVSLGQIWFQDGVPKWVSKVLRKGIKKWVLYDW